MHMHAIGVPEGVTLVDLEGSCQQLEEPAQEAQPPEPKGSEEVLLECPQHEPASFVKGKPEAF